MFSRLLSVLCLTCTLALSLSLLPAAAALAGSEFDIPTSELNKVRKKPPLKSESRKKKKKSTKSADNTTDKPAQPTSQDKVGEPARHTASPASVVDSKNSIAAEQPIDGVLIHHTPYSFIVAGKATVVQAVISSKSELQKLSCSLRLNGENRVSIAMEKVKGTQFTYTATLPALSPQDSALTYMITAVDSNGTMIRSKEYTVPLSDVPLVPSWQIDTPEKSTETKP